MSRHFDNDCDCASRMLTDCGCVAHVYGDGSGVDLVFCEQHGGIDAGLLREAAYIAHQFVCVSPLFRVLTTPHIGEDAQRNEAKIRADEDLAVSVRDKIRAIVDVGV